MPNPATVVDVEQRFRPLTPSETTVASTLLGDAWEMLLGRRPNLEADIASGSISEATVVRVLANMVVRVLRNPDGFLQESIDDYTYRRDAVMSTGLLHLTPDELADITPGRARNRSVRLVAHGDA